MTAIVRTNDGREYTIDCEYGAAREEFDVLARNGYQRWDVTLATGETISLPISAVSAILSS